MIPSIRALFYISSIALVFATGCSQEASANQGTAGQPSQAERNGPGARVGAQAPGFALFNLDGKQVKLDDFKGKIVVLEWFNPECPFVKYAHQKGPLRKLAQETSGKDLVWLAINSSGKDRQGHGVEKNRTAARQFGMKHPILIDEDGKVGKLYGAKSTPHMFVINAKGVLAYVGALDNAPLGAVEGDRHINYISQAIKELRAGKAISTPKTQAYGCSVKYAK